MKRLILSAATLVLCTLTLSAQKIGYINTETILSAIPEYRTAQEQLKKLSDQYTAKIEADYQAIEQLYQNYQSSKAMLNESQRAQRESEIITREREVKELQKNWFGQDGTMQKKTEELLAPIRDKVQAAIDKIARQEGFMIIFDLAALQGVVYEDSGYDLSAQVLNLLK